jgi:hypothetical protein
MDHANAKAAESAKKREKNTPFEKTGKKKPSTDVCGLKIGLS